MSIGQKNIVDLPGGKAEGDGGGDPKPRGSSSSSSRKKTPRTLPTEAQLQSRLTAVIDRIATAADARGDDELAETLREDRDIMATGLVSLTRPLTALRTPLLLVLSVVEPFMAFSRIVRLMAGRIMVRRAERVTPPPTPEGAGVPGH